MAKPPTKICYIMRGLPGSGKSTWACELGMPKGPHWGQIVQIFTTDDYWYRPDHTYDFNPRFLPQAHAWNFAKFERVIEGWTLPTPHVVVVDNTNIKIEHFMPYVLAAKAASYEVRIETPNTPWAWDVAECARRNQHGVPIEAIQRMKDTFEEYKG